MATDFIHKTHPGRLAQNSKPDSHLLYESQFFPCVKWRSLFGEGSFDQANTFRNCTVFPCSASDHSLAPEDAAPLCACLRCKEQDLSSANRQSSGESRAAIWRTRSPCDLIVTEASVCCLHIVVSLLLGPSLCCLFRYKSWSLVLPASCSFPELDVIYFFFFFYQGLLICLHFVLNPETLVMQL